MAANFKRIYQSATANKVERQLTAFEQKWDSTQLAIAQLRRRNWPRLTPFFDYPPEIHKVICTTNAIESLDMGRRKLTKNWSSFPIDRALLKLCYLELRNISKKWTMPIRD